jgi:TonB family protein
VSAAVQERNVTGKRMSRVFVAYVACSLLLVATARAQDALSRAKDLYLSAAYDEALVVLEQLKSQPTPAAPEVAQYRVFCLLALQRSDEAHKAIEDIVTTYPFYHPSETETSPRIRSVFDETRRALLPGLVQKTYADAKVSFEKKDPKALTQFELVLKLLDDPDLKNMPQLADMRTVVNGFRDLSKAMSSAPTANATKPADVPVPPRAESAPAQTAAVVDAPAPEGSPLGFTPPVVISQPIPRWTPPNDIDRRSAFKGLIEVMIDENGSVTSATIQQSVHPTYDEKLLAMARTWKYKPALRNGVPTSSVKVVAIQLQPAR